MFLDRDGTIVEDPGFLHEPDKVKLLPGAAAAIRQLNDHGFVVVVVTNQSGIARGLYTVAEYTAVQRRLSELLAAGAGAHLDGCQRLGPARELFEIGVLAHERPANGNLGGQGGR